ncbi:hypothetical protein ABZ354_25010 [Streptomyces sp. NPDC005925]|uniref:hypothetical protein n=1 Tax=Streptomyces sp. NPDC005925 TaxID=3157172 RepID=UPI0033EACEDD
MHEQENSRARRRSAALLLCCAAALVPWIVYLAITMGSREYLAARWGMAWVGLDIAEVVGLLSAALLVRRRDFRASLVAAATGTLFLVDAWFDTVTSSTMAAQVQSIFFASAAELPLTVFCAVTAWRAVHWLGAAAPASRASYAQRSGGGE